MSNEQRSFHFDQAALDADLFGEPHATDQASFSPQPLASIDENNDALVPHNDHFTDNFDDYDPVLDDPLTPEQQQSLLEGQFEAYYMDPELTAGIRVLDGLPRIDEDAYAAWLGMLSPALKRDLDEAKRERQEMSDLHERIHERTTSQVPELYKAHLPQMLEARLEETRYAIGLNQTMASTAEEAQEYLGEYAGVDNTGYNLDQRFLIYDQDMDGSEQSSLENAIDYGYTVNPSIGRFVAVFPEAHPNDFSERERLRLVVNLDDSVMPEDMYVPSPVREGGWSVSAKYIAGFIDENGDFWSNQNFMISSKANLQRFAPNKKPPLT